MKKAFIRTFGCKMNEYDSQRMAQLLGKGGYKLVLPTKAEEASSAFWTSLYPPLPSNCAIL